MVEKFILQLEGQLAERGVTIELKPEARAWLGKRAMTRFMARALSSRVIQEEVKKPLAEELLFGALQKGGAVTVGLDKDTNKLTFEYHASSTPPKAQSDKKRDETVRG